MSVEHPFQNHYLSEITHQTLFSEVPCYITIQDRELRIVEANRRFREDFGEGIGGHCYEVYKHRQEECLVCPVARTFSDGNVHSSEEVVVSKNGDPINVLVYTAPIRNTDGEIVLVMEMSTNISEIRRLQSQLTSMGQLVASISHSIKGILMGLDGGIYIVNSGFDKGENEIVKKGWEMVQRNVERISNMVFDILFYAKERKPEFSKVSPREIATDVCDLLQRKAVGYGIELKREFNDGTGEMEADQKAIHTLLVNLLENAIDACFTDRKKRSHKITVRIDGDEKDVVFEVSDDGIGMDEETKGKIFSLFFSTKGSGGTGLGLLVSHKIVSDHGGTITVNSAPDGGSHFVVLLPREREAVKR
ncbi:MAG: ATP-binding protein [bacterium]